MSQPLPKSFQLVGEHSFIQLPSPRPHCLVNTVSCHSRRKPSKCIQWHHHSVLYHQVSLIQHKNVWKPLCCITCRANIQSHGPPGGRRAPASPPPAAPQPWPASASQPPPAPGLSWPPAPPHACTARYTVHTRPRPWLHAATPLQLSPLPVLIVLRWFGSVWAGIYAAAAPVTGSHSLVGFWEYAAQYGTTPTRPLPCLIAPTPHPSSSTTLPPPFPPLIWPPPSSATGPRPRSPPFPSRPAPSLGRSTRPPHSAACPTLPPHSAASLLRLTRPPRSAASLLHVAALARARQQPLSGGAGGGGGRVGVGVSEGGGGGMGAQLLQLKFPPHESREASLKAGGRWYALPTRKPCAEDSAVSLGSFPVHGKGTLG